MLLKGTNKPRETWQNTNTRRKELNAQHNSIICVLPEAMAVCHKPSCAAKLYQLC